jgi:hypothetical protein
MASAACYWDSFLITLVFPQRRQNFMFKFKLNREVINGHSSLMFIGAAVVRFEIFTDVTMKNGVFWDVTPCDSRKNRHSGGT